MMNFWKNKRVLVTGHTGFVGTWLCMVLEHFGAHVIGFSLKEEEKSLYSIVKSKLSVENYYGDLTVKNDIEKCIKNSKPEIVFHLAAYGFIRECMNDPEQAFLTNIMGTVYLMEIIGKSTSIRSIILASSDKVYKNVDAENVRFDEEDSLGGKDPYSCSKTCEDMVLQSYFNSNLVQSEVNASILRLSNILGGGDHNSNRLIPSMLNSISMGILPDIRNPQSIRPWQHILDATDAYLYVGKMNYLRKISPMQIYNVGPNEKEVISVGEIAEIFLELSKHTELEKTSICNDNNTIEHKFLGLNSEKINSELNWHPKKSIYETLEDVYQFFVESSCFDVYSICKKQIDDYYM